MAVKQSPKPGVTVHTTLGTIQTGASTIPSTEWGKTPAGSNYTGFRTICGDVFKIEVDDVLQVGVKG